MNVTILLSAIGGSLPGGDDTPRPPRLDSFSSDGVPSVGVAGEGLTLFFWVAGLILAVLVAAVIHGWCDNRWRAQLRKPPAAPPPVIRPSPRGFPVVFPDDRLAR